MPLVVRKPCDYNNQMHLILLAAYYSHVHTEKSGPDGGTWGKYSEPVFIFCHHGLQLGSVKAPVTTSWTGPRAFY